MKLRCILLCLTMLVGAFSASAEDPSVTAKHVRNYINKGNQAYKAKDYAAAETYYRDALQADRRSATAMFNLALTLLQKNGNPLTKNQGGANEADNAAKDSSTDPIALFNDVIALNQNDSQVNNAFYNLGNIYFEADQLEKSIESYKEVLRRDPDHMKARQNLRIAQLKLKDRQQNQQNDQNKNQNQQNQNDQQNNNQDKQNNNNQQQNNNQNDQNNQDKKDSGQSNQNNQPEQKKNDQSNTSSGRPAMSKDNSDKILESAKKQEEQTRKKVEQRRNNQNTQRTTDRPW
ncbi:MAG: tetratricopeptide repeat protein [Bacteroides sp.]|nr:tetratricopeptide repeat protein [Bacteroides sp.]